MKKRNQEDKFTIMIGQPFEFVIKHTADAYLYQQPKERRSKVKRSSIRDSSQRKSGGNSELRLSSQKKSSSQTADTTEYEKYIYNNSSSSEGGSDWNSSDLASSTSEDS